MFFSKTSGNIAVLQCGKSSDCINNSGKTRVYWRGTLVFSTDTIEWRKRGEKIDVCK